MSKRITFFAFCALTAIAGAQTIAVGAGTFVDISTTGGIAIIGVSDDSAHTFVSTIGNGLFPSGNVTVGNNGVAISGTAAGSVGFTNAAIVGGGNAVPVGLVGGASSSYLCPWWDDLYPINGNTTIWHQELNGVLYIMWYNDGIFVGVAGQTIRFEIQVFGICGCAGPSLVKFLYDDTIVGGTQAANDNGASATCGYVASAASGLVNVPYSFNTPVLTTGLVLDLAAAVGSPSAYIFCITSPGGPGTVQLDIADCSGAATGYFIPYTTVAGAFPAGWLYGLDIDLASVVNIWNSGYPFVGSLPFTISAGLPSGFQFWMAAIGLNGSNTPIKAISKTYTIP